MTIIETGTEHRDLPRETSTRRAAWAGGMLLVLLLSGCATGGAGVTSDVATSQSALQAQYNRAIRNAAVFESANVLPLLTIETDSATVVSWATNPQDFTPGQPATLTDVVWVTLVPEVQDQCKAFPPDQMNLRLQQLLGLPPDDTQRSFVVLRAATADIFRPCPDPSVTAGTCSETMPDSVSDDYARWFAGQSLSSYQIPDGYPWTHLGYTYNWYPGAASRYGSSEFVINDGATVQVLSVASTGAYCQ